MKKALIITLAVLAFLYSTSDSVAGQITKLTEFASTLKGDYGDFYLDGGNLLKLGAGVAGAGVLANTSADREFHEYYRDDLKSRTTDNASKLLKLPGEALVALPILAGTKILFEDTVAGPWADMSLRALLVGGPAGLAIQYAGGGGRPKEGDSKWRPFKNNNTLSGHAFIGAAPLIVAAKMQDNVCLKGLFYGLSFLPGLTRINDGEHYISQVSLGWYLAYLSADKVFKKSGGVSSHVEVLPFKDGAMLSFSRLF
ncbi:MAG: hypothetical protein HY893_00750 [Deltaproteobacteria bacterium]|nr:hypothetical protein [Deltaproteobacteria bacterium]